MWFAIICRMHIRIRIAAAIVALALPFSAVYAAGLSAVLNGKSFHLGATQDWNEDNYGLGVEFEFDSTSRWKTRLMANGFRDSSEKMSYMAGGGIHRNLLSTDRLRGFYIDAGINGFIMTRKDINNNKPFPGVLPSLTVGNKYVGMNVTYLPRKAVENLYDRTMTDKSISGIVFVQFKISVDPD